MSLLQLGVPRSTATLVSLRSFSTSHVLLARKAKLAGATRKSRTSKKRAKTSIYDAEKMTLADAVHVLRVRPRFLYAYVFSNHHHLVR
jgi:hypothetical protein